jgi:tRNA-splicing ligase RtcB
VVLLVHCGSRGLGHQVATDYIRRMMPAMSRHGIRVPDRELACAPFSSPEGTSYFAAMSAAANFAWANRQVITWSMRRAWRETLGAPAGELRLLYDVSHNLAKLETHDTADGRRRVILHRKGATRAFGPGHPELDAAFQATGQPVLIPGSMGTASFVLAGDARSLERSFGSCCHGAGRRLSRMAAKRKVVGRELVQELLAAGIVVQAGSWSGVAEEAPIAYKDVDRVVEVVERAGIARRVARLTPLAVVKG